MGFTPVVWCSIGVSTHRDTIRTILDLSRVVMLLQAVHTQLMGGGGGGGGGVGQTLKKCENITSHS